MNFWLLIAGWFGLSVPVALVVGAMARSDASGEGGSLRPAVLPRRRNVAAH